MLKREPNGRRWTKGKDTTRATFTGVTASQLTATKVSVSEASAANFKSVKLLEQIMSVPATKTKNPGVATMENVTEMED
jgi:hypothetical protein